MNDFSNCKKAFYDELEFRVHADVYEPAEDSFALAKHVPGFSKGEVLDVGTGSGILAIVAGLAGAEVTGVDVSRTAVENAEYNAQKNGVDGRFLLSNLFEELEEEFDLIIFNPPYLPTSPEERTSGSLNAAWDGGLSGHEVADKFIAEAPEFLKKEGMILTLASSLSGINKISEKLKESGLKPRVVDEVPLFHERLAVIAAGRK